jgi:indolepyruvate ferredoxin oxidoreductase beta subunit
MTGLQEHPGTGRTLGGAPTGRLVFEDLIRSLGIENLVTLDPIAEPGRLEHVLRDALGQNTLTVIVVRRRCLLATARDAREAKREQRGEANGKAAAGQPPVAGEPRGPTVESPSSGTPLGNPSGRSTAVNVVIAGLGGQGVLTASDVLADAAVLAGFDVKKAEVHGMSQRGGSVACDVRFGARVLSPMVPPGEADVLLVLADDQVDNHRHRLRQGGVVITPEEIRELPLPSRRTANVALLGVLSRRLEIDDVAWRKAIGKNVKPELVEVNRQAFELGRQSASE